MKALEKTLYDLGDQQLAIIEALWERGPVTVRQVQERIDPERALAYTSVLSALQKLERVGWVCHERRGKSHFFRAVPSRKQATLAATRKFVHRTFRGDLAALLRLIQDPSGTTSSMPSLRSLVDQRRTVP